MFKIFNYNNIGKKIKGFAKWAALISIILVWAGCALAFMVSLMGFFSALVNSYDYYYGYSTAYYMVYIVSMFWSFCIAAVYPVIAWLASWLLYGFGEAVDKLCIIADATAGKTKAEQIAEPEVKSASDKRAEKLKALRDQGLITDDEYNQAVNKED